MYAGVGVGWGLKDYCLGKEWMGKGADWKGGGGCVWRERECGEGVRRKLWIWRVRWEEWEVGGRE